MSTVLVGNELLHRLFNFSALGASLEVIQVPPCILIPRIFGSAHNRGQVKVRRMSATRRDATRRIDLFIGIHYWNKLAPLSGFP